MNKNNSWSISFRYAVGILLFVGIAAFLTYAREAVKMLVIAAFCAYLISPMAKFLVSKSKLSRRAAVNIVYFSALVFLVGIPATLTPIFFDEIKIVAQDLLEVSNELGTTLSNPVQFGGWVFHFEQVGASFAHLQDAILTPLPEEALALLESTSINVLWLLVILVSVHLFMSEWPTIKDWMLSLAPTEYSDEMKGLYSRLRDVWMAYLRGQIVLMIVVGIVFTIAWWIMGIPGALVLGVIAGLFTLVPDVGPFLAALLAVAVALLEGSSWIPLSNVAVAILVFAAYLVLINLKNFLVRPYIIGRSLHMNESLIFISIMMATILEGILGALLVVPVLASAIVIFEYIRRRLLGMSPFDESSDMQFQAPESKIKIRGQKVTKKAKKK